jgi:hypothetical protein
MAAAWHYYCSNLANTDIEIRTAPIVVSVHLVQKGYPGARLDPQTRNRVEDFTSSMPLQPELHVLR